MSSLINTAPRAALVTIVLALSFAACSRHPVAMVEVIDGVPYGESTTLAVYRPPDTVDAGVAVLLHGCCGERADVAQLALALAAKGFVVFNASWTIQRDGGGWPTSYRNAACAVAFAASSAANFGGDKSRIVLVGWSDGALLASVVAMGSVDSGSGCRATTPAAPAAVVGLAGFYGYGRGQAPESDAAQRFLGAVGSDGRPGDPHTYLATASRVPTWLVVGTEDKLLVETQAWSATLSRDGHPVTMLVAEGTHFDIVSPRTSVGALAIDTIVGAGSRADD